MQQTKTYKLNLVDKNDTFSPDPLNDNAQKTEQALKDAAAALTAETNARKAAVSAEEAARKAADTAEASARQTADADEAKARQAADTAETNARKSAVSALDQRLKVFEAHKLAVGTYMGTQNSDRFISVGFTPKFMLISSNQILGCACYLMAEDQPIYHADNPGHIMAAEIVEGGFRLFLLTNTVNELDARGVRYIYLAYA